jgi:hypothetical protein
MPNQASTRRPLRARESWTDGSPLGALPPLLRGVSCIGRDGAAGDPRRSGAAILCRGLRHLCGSEPQGRFVPAYPTAARRSWCGDPYPDEPHGEEIRDIDELNQLTSPSSERTGRFRGTGQAADEPLRPADGDRVEGRREQEHGSMTSWTRSKSCQFLIQVTAAIPAPAKPKPITKHAGRARTPHHESTSLAG